MRAGFRLLLIALFCGSFSATASAEFYVLYNPYQDVDWTTDHRCLTQLHDHVYTYEPYYRAYDQAGYNAVSVLHYSGVMGTYQGSAWHERRWPLTAYMPNYSSDQAFLNTCQNLKILIPNAEEVGYDHITSPFLTTYIAKWEPEYYAQREPWHYESSQECLNLISQYGGLGFIAHPWGLPTPSYYLQFQNYRGIEVYSAYATYFQNYGGGPNLNARLQSVWDALLVQKSTKIWGTAVNDWYGPNWAPGSAYPDAWNSGKTIVMIKEWSLPDLRESVDRGAFLAVRDIGLVKNQYPVIDTINVGNGHIVIATAGTVRWISDGAVVGQGPDLNLSVLPYTAHYVRAEVDNEYGTVFVQPFTLRRTEDDEADFLFQNVKAFVSTMLEQGPDALSHDMNGDGLLDGADIQGFVDSKLHPPEIPPPLLSPPHPHPISRQGGHFCHEADHCNQHMWDCDPSEQ